MHTKACLFVAGFALLLLPVPARAQAGDEPDGSRTRYVHAIPLYPEDRDLDKGFKITPDQTYPMPFSMRWSCNNCHDYDRIAKGFHFNSTDGSPQPGRLAQPWIYVDPALGVQAPLSTRPWPQVYRPDRFGISLFDFVRRFGRQMPGGGPGETYGADPNDPQARLSGRLEVNCLACHSTDPGQDQGGAFGYADQVREGNFRWAATASSQFADVKGSIRNVSRTYDPYAGPTGVLDPNSLPPITWYRREAFDDHNDVFIDLTKRILNERCYTCHSNAVVQAEGDRILADEDVHMASGLRCVDCHRNGIDHQISRGYPGQSEDPNHAWTAKLTCEGCHLPPDRADLQEGSRMGAPRPEHKGLSLVHFDKLACTACHSGPLPRAQAGLVKTSRAHALGTTYANKADRALPHIVYPVFARQADGKIAPCKLIWPAFWATVQDAEGEAVPIPLNIVEPIARRVFRQARVPDTHDWPALTDETVSQMLAALSKSDAVKGRPVYVCGGRMHSLDPEGRLTARDHPAAAPVMWVAAHDVRPAGQALGARACEDCHEPGSAFFFGRVPVDTPMASGQGQSKPMSDFQGIDVQQVRVFGWSFVFRPWLKAAGLAACTILVLLILAFSGQALLRVSRAFSERGRD